MENPMLKWDDLGGKNPYFRKHPNLLQIQAISEGVQEPNSGASLCLDPAKPDPEGYGGDGDGGRSWIFTTQRFAVGFFAMGFSGQLQG